MAKMKEREVLQSTLAQVEDSEGYDTDELNGLRKDALDYYYNRDTAAPSAPGRSSLQSSDVADMVESVISQVMPAFEVDTIVDFEPLGEDDVDQARIETDAVNYVVMQQNRGYYEIQQAIRDALLLRNGIIKVYLKEDIDVTTEKFEDLTELEFGQMMQQHVEDLSQVDNGISVTEQPNELPGFHNATAKIKSTERQICTQAVDPSNFSWERDYDSIYLDDCRFVSERSLPTRSELLERGYSKTKVAKLNAGGNDTQIDTLARNQHSQRRNWRGTTPAQDIIETHECYYRIDIDGDGVAELWKIVIADKTILEQVEVEFIPYASGTPFLQPHRFNGLGMFDKLRYVQDAKTATLRQLIDNQNHANNARVGVVDGQVNVDDVVNSRPGGVVRMRSPNALVPFPFTDIGPSAQSTLDYLDKVRSERGGAALDLQNAQMQIAGETAHGIERQMSAKEQMSAMITRTLAETLIRTTFLLVHRSLRLYVPDEIQFRAAGQFVTVNPAEWRKRERVNVKAGLSLSERTKKATALFTVIQRQDYLAQNGLDGIMTEPSEVYNAQLDWMRAQGLTNPERYFRDPTSPEAQEAAQGKQEQAAQQQQFQQQLMELQQQVEQGTADREQAKIFEDARQFDKDLEFKYWEAGQKQEVEEAKLATQTALKMVDIDGEQDRGTGITDKQAIG